jgi:alkylation response protein AidB-like acyl-CoA dehydrogenase
MNLGAFDAALLMEEAGRTLASGPIAETLLAARLLAQFGSSGHSDLLGKVVSGESVATLAYHDIAEHPVQWVAGGAVADTVIARNGDSIVAISLGEADRRSEPTLASNGLGELALANLEKTVLATGPDAIAAFARAVEEWKLLIAAGLAGLTQEAIRLAAAYACERSAFGQPIGTYQGISHPLADLRTDADGGKLLVWKVIHAIANGSAEAAALVPLAAWWNADTAARAVAQALRTFGGYGLTT